MLGNDLYLLNHSVTLWCSLHARKGNLLNIKASLKHCVLISIRRYELSHTTYCMLLVKVLNIIYRHRYVLYVKQLCLTVQC